MAGFYDDPNSPGYNSGFGQLKRAAARGQDDAAVAANPVGPPSLLTPPLPTVGATRTYVPGFGAARGGVETTSPLVGETSEAAPYSGGFGEQAPDFGRHRPIPLPRVTSAAPAASAAPIAPMPSLSQPQPRLNPTTAVIAADGALRAPSGATSVNGRQLGYGAMVNGVRTFSDGSGGPGAPPATMTKAQIDALGNESRLSRADAGTGGGIGSEAFRLALPAAGGSAASNALAGTPELGSAAGYALTRPTPAQGGVFHMPPAASQAASDLASIVGRDTRSPLGLAMRNFDVEVKGRTHPGRAGAMQALAAPAMEGLRQAGAIEQEGQQQTGANARAQLDANAGIQREIIARRPQPQNITLADGSLGIQGPDGVVRSAIDAQGNPVRPQVGKPAMDLPTYGKMLSENTNRLLGIDPNDGMITPDPDKPKERRKPSAEEIYRATQTARDITNSAFGGGDSNGGSAPQKVPDRAPVGTATATDPKTGKKIVYQNGKWVNA